jgi:hypothetical protein
MYLSENIVKSVIFNFYVSLISTLISGRKRFAGNKKYILA